MDRSRSTQPAPQRSGFLTPRQAVVLLILAALGLLILGLIALRMLAPDFFAAQTVSPQPSAVAQVPALPPSGVTEPEAPAAALTPEPSQLLPQGCEPVYGSLYQSSGAAVIDSQTIEVWFGADSARISLAGIALPVEQPAASEAVEELLALIDGQPVVLALAEEAATPNGSRAAYIYANGWFLNHELIMRGMARVDTAAPGQACAGMFQQAEQQAKSARAGIWQPTRVPTATFLPTVGLDPALQAPCDCMARPVCSDFRTRSEAQACYNACNDYNSRLDDDRDGLACEGLP